MHHDNQSRFLTAPDAVVVGGFDTERISPCGQIGIGGGMAVARLDPSVVKAVETVGKAILFRRAITQCRKGQCEHIVLVA